MKLLEELSITKDNADDTLLIAESNNDLKQLLMKVKEESSKTGLHLNTKKAKIMTTEEMYNFNKDNEDIKIFEDVAHTLSVIDSNEDCNQEIQRKLRLRKAETEELGKITKSKSMSLQTKLRLSTSLYC